MRLARGDPDRAGEVFGLIARGGDVDPDAVRRDAVDGRQRALNVNAVDPHLEAAGVQHQIVRPRKARSLAVGHARRGQVDGSGDEAAVRHRAFEAIGLAHETADEGRDRLVVDLGRRADLFDPALIEDGDAVGQVERLFLVVGDEDRGHARGVMHAAQFLAQRLAHRGVQGAEGLVQQQHAGLHGQGPRQSHALALAARQLRRVAAAQAFQLDQAQQLIDPPGDLGLRRLVIALAHVQAERDVSGYGHVLEQRILLEHEAHAARGRRGKGDVLVVEQHLTGVGKLQAGDHAQQRRLAGTRRSQQRQQLAVGDLEPDLVQRRIATELLFDGTDGDGHGVWRSDQ